MQNKYYSFPLVNVREKDIKNISDSIIRYIWDNIFKEIFKVLQGETPIFNAKNTALITAIQKGLVYYENGAFKTETKFSNEVAKELENIGAKFQYGSYYLAEANVPPDIASAISIKRAKDASALMAILKYLNDFDFKKERDLLIKEAVKTAYDNLYTNLAKSTSKRIMPTIGEDFNVITHDFSDEEFKKISQYWVETDKQADDLRNKIRQTEKDLKDIQEQRKNANATVKIPLEKDLETELNKQRQNLRDLRKKQATESPTLDFKTDEITTDDLYIPSFDRDKLKVYKDKRAAAQAEKIARDYTENMKYWVKKWETKEIIEMRQDVVEMVKNGARESTVAKYFQRRWKIAKKKADFLARNECELASSVIKAVHYQSMGCKYFYWIKSTSPEKRPLHLEYAKETNNKYGINKVNIFVYDNLPIIDELTGQRGLPGQIYNCRCSQIGVYTTAVAQKQEDIENAQRNFFTKLKYTISNSLQQPDFVWKYRRFDGKR